MEHSCEAGVSLATLHRHPFELFQLTEEVLDEMPPLVDVSIKNERCCPVDLLQDHEPGAALVQLSDDPICVESLVRDQAVELDAGDERSHLNRVVAPAWQQTHPDKIAQGIPEG